MNLDDRLDRARDELADEVASDVRVPSFDGVLVRRARRRRLQAAAGGAALVVVAAGVLGGVAATRPDAHRSVPPAATVSASTPPTASATATPSALSDGQTYPAKGASYVIVPDGDQLAWTDLKTGAHGHFGPADGSQLSEPSVSSSGDRVAYLRSSSATSAGQNSVGYWDLGTRSGGVLATATSPLGVQGPSISPDGTRVAFVQFSSGIHIATIGTSGPSLSVPTPGVPGVQVVAWTGNDALAYLPPGGSDCAVERIMLGASAERCLLPTATLQSLPASNGAPWQVVGVNGAGDTALLALDITTMAGTRPVLQAVGILNPSAEATPLHVLTDTVTSNSVAAGSASPVLLDQGTRVAYATISNTQTPAASTILLAPVAGGPPTTVASTPGNGANGGGLGATSG